MVSHQADSLIHASPFCTDVALTLSCQLRQLLLQNIQMTQSVSQPESNTQSSVSICLSAVLSQLAIVKLSIGHHQPFSQKSSTVQSAIIHSSVSHHQLFSQPSSFSTPSIVQTAISYSMFSQPSSVIQSAINHHAASIKRISQPPKFR